MTITYELGNSLYVNITNRCSNACNFCVRLEHDGVNGKDSLWLDREPTVDEIKADFETRKLEQYNAVVFCGYGEPMERADVVIEIAKWLKTKMPELPIRINTNGQANLIYKRDITPELCGIIDCISISLNAENAQKYQDVCNSEFGEAAYEGLLDFARRAKEFVPEVIFTVVDIMPKDEIAACRKIADDCGVSFRVREYIE
ncbi:MAG: TIGR04100 family radical SAM protein [Clostridia bacterium]|nr:TIGR04100 family radical SAM protein [Clostridia bacterium]